MIRINMSLLFCCFIFLNTACNQKTDKKPVESIEEDVIEKPELKKVFSLTLNALVKEEDVFSLFYTQFEGEKFGVDQLIHTKVYPSDEIQEIKFELPESDYPYNIRLDFGSNPSQENIMITECDLKYSNSSYKIKASELYKYFNFNEGIEILQDSTTFKLKKFTDASGEKYDPYIVGNDRCVIILQEDV
ncbi:hypothetical protein [Bizionia arctica]|uniref:Uncharacterized protein n=1 Tax=Bizionia arctica TaxID=1495645 RepID=A0A917GBY1_9FLAO|nr:hypothetical protein [Bizionia arctica]GGG36611.1 hypothetical protein GCM10010976_05370 [Bizionia arctica]